MSTESSSHRQTDADENPAARHPLQHNRFPNEYESDPFPEEYYTDPVSYRAVKRRIGILLAFVGTAVLFALLFCILFTLKGGR